MKAHFFSALTVEDGALNSEKLRAFTPTLGTKLVRGMGVQALLPFDEMPCFGVLTSVSGFVFNLSSSYDGFYNRHIGTR